MTTDVGHRLELHSIMFHAKALADMQSNLDDAIRLAWQRHIPNRLIAEAAGVTDAVIRMQAIRKGWRR